MSLPRASQLEALDSTVSTQQIASGRREKLKPIDPAAVTLGGEFGRRVNQIIEANILHIDIEKTFLEDFRNRGEGGYLGLGKFIDAVIRLAATIKDPRLLDLRRRLITALLSTQDDDGYIGTVREPGSRIKVLWDLHEGAYIIWALVSDHQFFNSSASLEAAQRLADFFVAHMSADRHLRPEVQPYNFPFEVTSIGLDRSLLALSDATAQMKYRNFVVDVLRLEQYNPAIACGTISAANHAYTYFSHCLAQLDLYRKTADPRLLTASKRVISFLLQGDGLLVTGSCSHWECWHDTQSGLQNTSETCASAYLSRLMESMLRLEGDSIYGDIMERDIYNALFAATSPDGRRSRYYTAFDGKRVYDPSGNRYCCANNNKRFLADLSSWIFYRTDAGVAINLYTESSCKLTLDSGITVGIEQQTNYPTSGKVRLKINPSAPHRFEIRLRIPRWCQMATISIGNSAHMVVNGGEFSSITREWNPGDTLEIDMPMGWRFIRGRKAQVGRAAILRGPAIFTFNPERNRDLCAHPEFEARLLRINPLEIAPVVADNSVRPGGLACVIQAWPPGHENPWPFVERVPVTLSEYADPNGEAIYFIVPGEGRSLLVEDELLPTDTKAIKDAASS